MPYKNKEDVKANKVAYYLSNRDDILAKRKIYHIEHQAERIHKQHKYYETNKKQILEYKKKYAQTEAGHSNKLSIEAGRRSKMRIALSEDERVKVKDIYIKAQRLSKNTGTDYHVDHIIPLSKGGLHHPDNLQILTATDNLRKSSKICPDMLSTARGNTARI